MTRAGRLRLPPDVVLLLRGLHPDLKRRVRAALDRMVAQPSAGKALRADLAGLRGFRVGRTRIVYRESSDVIEVVAVGPRERIYEETLAIRGDPVLVREIRRGLRALRRTRKLYTLDELFAPAARR